MLWLAALGPSVALVQHIKLERLLLAAHCELTQPAPRDAGGSAAKRSRRPRRRGCGRPRAAGVDDAGDGVHRIADQRDLFLQIAEFADSDGTAVKASAEVGHESKFALIGRRLGADAVERREAGADACRFVWARREPPGRDHLVADIFVNFAAGLRDGERHIGDEAVEQIEKPEFAEALGDRGRGAHVDEEQRALLDARMVVAPRGEGEERARTKKIVDAEQQVEADHHQERGQEVDAADRHEPTRRQHDRDGVHDEDNRCIKSCAQGEIRQKRQATEEPARVAAQYEAFEREKRGAHRAADATADDGRSMVKIAVEDADQGADDDDPDEAAKRGRMQHRRPFPLATSTSPRT